MGQCMSRKAAGAFAASAAVSQNRPAKMQKHQKHQSPDDENNKLRSPMIPQDTNKRQQRLVQTTATVGVAPATKGVAMSFGFRRPTPAPSIAANASAARRLANNAAGIDAGDAYDRNGNDARDTDGLTANAAPTGRSTPRLAPPKKEANATKVSRFGFRGSQNTRFNKVADVNKPPEIVNQNKQNQFVKKPIALTRTVMPTDNNNRTRIQKEPPVQIGKYTLQSTQLPRPEPIRVIETKTAKTLANNNRRVAGMYQHHPEETSSKDGSLTEDSGLGSHISRDADAATRGLDNFESSPTFGARRRRTAPPKPRSLEVVATGCNTFDVRDANDSNDSCDSASAPPLPQLPSAFHSTPEKRTNAYHSAHLVRDRAADYQRHASRSGRPRSTSKTSSDGFSDDYGEDEKTYNELFRSEKPFIKPNGQQPKFLKSRTNQLKCGGDSSPLSSDEQEWAGGEAMADDVSFSLSSSDESRDRNCSEDQSKVPTPAFSSALIASTFQNLVNNSLYNHPASRNVQSITLTIEDPKFAALAAASNSSSLLDDETLLSPDSISCSESEEIRRKLQRSSSNSKDINEKLTPPSPGTPTNASNSLSISDDNDNMNNSGKDDFLIDDEIADQPALIFEDSRHLANDNSTETLMESTPKQRRRNLAGAESSPSGARHKRFSQNRTGSLDTLSPCESIASDDLMMDFYSQSSGLDDCEAHSSGYPSMNETLQNSEETLEALKGGKDWNSVFMTDSYKAPDKHKRSSTSRSRLLSSRVSTPNSTVDSPKSLARFSRPSAANSPVRHGRLANLSSACGYDSDESIRLDRASHTAITQDIVGIKTLLLKLRRILNETAEEELSRSDAHNPFDSQHLMNGIFNSLGREGGAAAAPEDGRSDAKVMSELVDLRRQVLFLQGQLEDKEKTVQTLQEKMVRLVDENYHASSAPASTSCDSQTCNAATQTERIRPLSAGPSLLNGSPVDCNAGSLVSATESQSLPIRKARTPSQTADSTASRRTPSRLWRQPGEPPSPQRYATAPSTAPGSASAPSSIPKRARSRTRAQASTS
ncbi:unnamed protein product [Phyllotreta striolata]|uniref:Uncharacterized protein n=1 Tax=Phyllotreta striolata TaxID=444603 RepID=A0A9N9XT07_PHYSR|nr:unnamed protein product [Phyllotreta striolata]